MNKFIILCCILWSTSYASFLKEQTGLKEFKDTIDRPFNYLDSNAIGDFQLKRHGKKFLSVSSADGYPLAIFDLSLSPLGWKEILLGSFKIKDFMSMEVHFAQMIAKLQKFVGKNSKFLMFESYFEFESQTN